MINLVIIFISGRFCMVGRGLQSYYQKSNEVNKNRHIDFKIGFIYLPCPPEILICGEPLLL